MAIGDKINLTSLNNLQATDVLGTGQQYLLNVNVVGVTNESKNVISSATATNGVVLPIDSLAVTYSGGAPSTPNAVWVNTVSYLGNTYTQTYTFNSSGNLASITAWTKV